MYDINKQINFGEDGMIRSIIALTCFATKHIPPPNFEKNENKRGVFFSYFYPLQGAVTLQGLLTLQSKYNLHFT